MKPSISLRKALSRSATARQRVDGRHLAQLALLDDRSDGRGTDERRARTVQAI